MANILHELKEQAEDEGFVPGTEPFESRLLDLRVSKCRELRREASCTSCEAADACSIHKEILKRRLAKSG